jgi:hypothetical protein
MSAKSEKARQRQLKKESAKKRAPKSSEAKAKQKQQGASQAEGGSTPARGSSDSTRADQKAADDRARAGADGNEAAIRRTRNQEGADKAARAMRGETDTGTTVPVGDKETQRAAAQLSKEFPGQVLGTSGARASGATDAATDDLSKRQQVVAEHTAGASHGALSVQGDASRGQVDPIPEGARPQGGGSPVLGEHVVGDTEFRGSRGLADRTVGAGKGQKVGAASLAADSLPRGFKPGKSPESEQRDSSYDGNRAAAAAPPSAGTRSAKAGSEVKLLFVVTDYRENGPADTNPNSITAIMKAAPPGLDKKNAEFFGGVTPSGTIALNAFSTEYDDVFAMGELYEVTIKPRSASGAKTKK